MKFFLAFLVSYGVVSSLDTEPLFGLLYQPRVMMSIKKLMEWLSRESEVLPQNLS
jgi:hypothetical protein